MGGWEGMGRRCPGCCFELDTCTEAFALDLLVSIICSSEILCWL